MSCPCIGQYCSRYPERQTSKRRDYCLNRMITESSPSNQECRFLWSRFRKPCVPALLFAPRRLEVDDFLQLALHSTATLAICAYSTDAEQWRIASISCIDAAVRRDNAGSSTTKSMFLLYIEPFPANNAMAWNRGYVCRWPKLASPTEFIAYRRATMCEYSARSLSLAATDTTVSTCKHSRFSTRPAVTGPGQSSHVSASPITLDGSLGLLQTRHQNPSSKQCSYHFGTPCSARASKHLQFWFVSNA